ncbi:universal stress protein [Sulfitobacter sp. JB4-11]|uniref:universal stress protein n=1 Tax=Sulfitobacter rhodophyticola TaxID=3238304 RepID=UPI003511900F
MYNNILVPIALDHEHPSGPSLDIAKRLLNEGGTITALHVMEELPAYVLQHIEQGQRDTQRADFEKALKAEIADVPNGKAALVMGHSGRTILDYAASHDNDCIVIASHRPGLQDYLLGSTAARVVRHAQCAVHVLR